MDRLQNTLCDLIDLVKNNRLTATNDDYVVDLVDVLRELLTTNPPATTKKINRLDDASIPAIELPVLKDLSDAPSALFYFDGPSHPKGVYIAICKGFCIKVPFPHLTYRPHPDVWKFHQECKHHTAKECQRIRTKYATIHNTDVRECNYVHKGERFVRLGSSDRCSIERLGCHETLHQDLTEASTRDIKKVLLNATADIALAAMWYQNVFSDGNLIICNCATL
jgi:hypothetical protein